MMNARGMMCVALMSMCLGLAGCGDGAVGGDMPTGTPAPTAEADAQAANLLSQMQEKMAAKDWAGAEAIMSQLEGMKSTVGADVVTTIENAKVGLTAAKAGG